MGWGVSVTPRLLSIPWKDPVPIVEKAGWAPGPVWTDEENFAPTGIRSPDHQDFPHLSGSALETNQSPVQWVSGLSRGRKRPGLDVDPLPTSSAEE
jgi:hypothetical protein